MGQVVGIFVVLLALAVGFVFVTESRTTAALFDAFLALPLPSQAAWSVIVIIPVALLICLVWFWRVLAQQRRTAQALEWRLEGVRDGVKGLVKTQAEVETDVHRLARSDPEDALGAIRERLSEAERFAQVQHSRNEATDLQSRVDHIRAQQQALKERLVPVLERRRAIEQLFAELDSRQIDLNRTLDEIATADDAAAIEVGLNNMAEFVKRSHARCDEIERAAKIMAGLKEDFAGLRGRLDPLAAAEGGIACRIQELRDARDRLSADIDSLQHPPEGALAARVETLTEDKKVLDRRLWELNEEFSKLAGLRKDLDGLFVGFNRALDVLAIAPRGEGAAAVDARAEELSAFIAATQAHLGQIEQRLASFGQVKTKLLDLKTRLVPLEAAEGGVMCLIGELKDIREQLAAKMRRLEESDDGNLAERVRKYTDIKRELEERVATLSDQFFKLATIRNDIAGLFEKLSSAVAASAN